MSDFFSRLAERALGTGPAVRPLVASRFQDESGGDGFTEANAEREISAPVGSPGPLTVRDAAASSSAAAGVRGASTPGAAASSAAGGAFTPPALSPAAGTVLQRYASGATPPRPPNVASAGFAGESATGISSPIASGVSPGAATELAGHRGVAAGWEDDSPLVAPTTDRSGITRNSADDARLDEAHAEIDASPDAQSRRAPSDPSATQATAQGDGDPAGAARAVNSSPQRNAARGRDSIHPVVRASEESSAADATSPWGESAWEVEGDSGSAREMASGGRISSEVRGSARLPSTEDAGETSARGGRSDAARSLSPRSADDNAGEEDWLVPGQRDRARQARDAGVGPADGFDVIDDEVEGGRVVRSGGSTAGERAEMVRTRGERRAQTSSSAPRADAVTSTNAAADAAKVARAVEVSARRAIAAARDEASADAQARGGAASADGAEGGAPRSGEGQGTAIVPRQRSVAVTASVASAQSRSQSQAQARLAASRAEAERPVVHVTIGRIEVRAVTPPAAAPEPRPAPGWTPPVLSLDEYLKRGGNA